MSACTEQKRGRLWVALDSRTGVIPLRQRAALAETLLARLLRNIPDSEKLHVKLETTFRWGGYAWIESLMRMYGDRVVFFCDGKITGNKSTLVEDARECRRLGVAMSTLACTNGSTEALRAFKKYAPNVCALGVSELTSKIPNLPSVMTDSGHAMQAGLNGMIAPGYALKRLRQVHKGNIVLVTPNVRPEGVTVVDDDQHPSVSVTPSEARALGADDIVVGRPITDAGDPVAAYFAICQEFLR